MYQYPNCYYMQPHRVGVRTLIVCFPPNMYVTCKI